MTNRPCTCHPDDNPPRPCQQKYALSECKAAPAPCPVCHGEGIVLIGDGYSVDGCPACRPAAPAPALRRNLHVSPDADDGYTDYAAPAPDPYFLGLAHTLLAALKRLSFAAQTACGTAGRDDELVAAIAQAENAIKEAHGRAAAPAPEPVAWMVYTKDGKSVFVTDNPTDIPAECAALPLFTSPPAVVPPAVQQQAEPVGKVVAAVSSENDPAMIQWTSDYRPTVGDLIYAAPPADDEAVRLLREARRNPWKLQAVELEPECVGPAQEFQAEIDAYLAKVGK